MKDDVRYGVHADRQELKFSYRRVADAEMAARQKGIYNCLRPITCYQQNCSTGLNEFKIYVHYKN